VRCRSKNRVVGLHILWISLVTVAGVFGAAGVARDFEQTAFWAFDAAVHPCGGRQLILILQSCLLKPEHTNTHF